MVYEEDQGLHSQGHSYPSSPAFGKPSLAPGPQEGGREFHAFSPPMVLAVGQSKSKGLEYKRQAEGPFSRSPVTSSKSNKARPFKRFSRYS